MSLIRQLVEEFQLSLEVTLAPSREKRADGITRVSREWITSDAGVELTSDETATRCHVGEAGGDSGDASSDIVACAVTADPGQCHDIDDARSVR